MAKVFIGIHTTGWITAHVTKWLLAQVSGALDIGPGKEIEGIYVHIETGKPEDAAANKVMEAFLKTDFTHILKMDNDIMADLKLIPRLLSYDKDIVAAPVTLVQDMGITFAGCNILDGGKWAVPDITPPNDTLVGPLDFVGGGCIMVKRNVIETLRKKGPIYVTHYGEEGQVTMYCDNYFLKNAKDAGFEAYLDGSEVLGQVCEINLMQCINPGTWPRVKGQKSTVG